jgi:rare lipoprotein A
MIISSKIGRLAFLLFSCLFVILGTAYSSGASDSDKASVSKPEKEISADSETREGMAAVAVYYAKRYQGRRTSSGAKFDHNKMTAAHPTIPLGTRVKIVNEENGRSVEVVINDRCRKRSFELIDLTRAAATKLGYFGKKGKAQVRIFPVDDQVALNTETESESETED